VTEDTPVDRQVYFRPPPAAGRGLRLHWRGEVDSVGRDSLQSSCSRCNGTGANTGSSPTVDRQIDKCSPHNRPWLHRMAWNMYTHHRYVLELFRCVSAFEDHQMSGNGSGYELGKKNYILRNLVDMLTAWLASG